MSKNNVQPITPPKRAASPARQRLRGGAEISDEELDEAMSALNEVQRAKVQDVAARAKRRASAPPMQLAMEGDALAISYRGKNDAAVSLLLMAELGTCDPSFHAGIMRQVASLGAQGAKLDETNSNFVVSVVRAVEPRDELETMLAVQMGAVHAATMMMARRLNHVTTIPQQDAAERALNKLARTFATQMETLKRYRTGGQQKVTVEHVTVNAGGQAIVGAVSHGGGGQE